VDRAKKRIIAVITLFFIVTRLPMLYSVGLLLY
jgi:hypothetical protein